MQKRLVFVISAPSGGGKTSLVNALKQQIPSLEHVITHTTRPMRQGEVDGKDYHFVSEDTFRNLIAQDKFIEWAQIYEHQCSGITKEAIQKIWDEQKYPILNIDWQGARHIRQLYAKSAVTIFILPPSLDELKKRMAQRGDSAANIQKRLHAAQDEIDHASEYDHVILNECFDTALSDLKAVIDSHLR